METSTRSPRRLLDALQSAGEQMPQAVLVFDEAGTLLVANPPAGTIFGVPAQALVGETFERLFAPPPSCTSDIDRWEWFWNEAQTRSMSTARRMTAVRREGTTVPIEIGFSAMSDGESGCVVASIVDVTDRFALETRLLAATEAHLDFHRRVSDLAGRFASVTPRELDELIVTTLREIAEMLELDAAILWRRPATEDHAVPTHSWVRFSHDEPPVSFPIADAPYMVSRLEAGETVCFSRADELPNAVDRDAVRHYGTQSALILPMAPSGDEGVLYSLAFLSMTREHEWVPSVVERLRLVMAIISQALAHRASRTALQRALDELQHLRQQPHDAGVERRHTPKLARASRLIVSESVAVRRALAQLEQVAPTSATVLLLGETGAGKEVFAQAVHDLSPRHRRPLVVVNCAAIPSALLESELFGRERGAYTGALSRQIGRFEAANQSTLLLDEIGELSADMQVKLLRVLEDHVIERLGSPQPIKIDVRIIAATHRDLEKAVRDGTFRQDLFYRLNVFPVSVPPLRERVADIPGLVWTFVDEFSRAFGKTIDSIARDTMDALQHYPWPGNVRELRNVVERAVILATSRQLVVALPAPAAVPVPATAMTLASLEVEHIRSVLESTNWRVRGRGGAAERLGLKPTTLESRMARLGINRPAVA